jgi:hypothetical protein
MPGPGSEEKRTRRSIGAGTAARAVLRQKYGGSWVAWAADTLDRVVASAGTWGELRDILGRSRIEPDSVVVEWIDSVGEFPAPVRE